ncbi:MAG: cytochrome c-type biogenesis protein CcmH [Pseudomonadales bacterium]|nr:cytochrome c-type biogenesis protein CcmH [Pseudomonadales bacterium]
MMSFARLCAVVTAALFIVIAPTSIATIDVYEFENAQQEDDFRILVQELRCPKCQNQNIADSNAGLAKDIKDRAYKLLRDGKSKDYIIDYMVERYGDFITYRPPVTKNTWVLWFGPLILLVVVVLVLVLLKRTDPKPQGSAHITDEQKQRVDALLERYEQSGEKDIVENDVQSVGQKGEK